MSTDHLTFDLTDERWYDSAFGPMILHTQFANENSKPLDLLADVFSVIEDVGLEVKRIVVPSPWAKHLPIENGFLWKAWVSHDNDIAPIVATSNYRNSRPIRTVTVSWAD